MSGSFIEYLKYLSLSSIFEIQQVASLESGLVLEKIQYFHSLRVINLGQFPQAWFLFSKYSLKTSILLVWTCHVRYVSHCSFLQWVWSAELCQSDGSLQLDQRGGVRRSGSGAISGHVRRRGLPPLVLATRHGAGLWGGPLGYPYVFHVMLWCFGQLFQM